MTYTMPQLALIGAAERIVAERGIGSLTIKDVQVAANQANKSAVKYHFGSQSGLLKALIEIRMQPVAMRRQEMLDRMEQRGGPAQARDAVDALIRPLAAETLGREDSRYARFLIQTLFDPVLADMVQKHLQAESFRTVRQHLIDLCPVADPVATWRADNIVQLNMAALAAQEARSRNQAESAAVISDLIDTCVALLEAPASAATEESLGATP